ncbi:hypothetical protein [Microbispora sp. GKU 823]|uniref:hypothetical protein n=1 Tax=Microbispora sp. GKU 823 TaxID=1652100 RepID=UPI0009A31307|nr:hypothetical protein [Microbispora sp. GKU 823]OPG12522.1 hypothetical protein B1L11_14155 [Microbispora sp. GKU 823]
MSTRPHDKANELFEVVRVISQLLQLDNSEVAGLALELAKKREDWDSAEHSLLAVGVLAGRHLEAEGGTPVQLIL